MLGRSPAYAVDLIICHWLSFSLSERHPDLVLQTCSKSQTQEEGVTWGYFAGTILRVRPNNSGPFSSQK